MLNSVASGVDPFPFFAFYCSYRLCQKLKASVQSKVTAFSNGLVEFKNGYEFQLQRKLYRKRSVTVEIRFISCVQ